jgi:hypothetical protein
MNSCVTDPESLARWSGQACAAWPGRTPEEKRQWVRGYFQAHGMHANDVSVGALVSQMNARCSARPAGVALAPTTTTDIERILTSPSFNQTLQTALHEIGTTTSAGINSANRTNTYAPNTGYPGGGYSPQSGIYGGFNAPGAGYGSGAISWTPIIIGGAIAVALVLVVASSQRRAA